jgi:pimeloyl-ACP methyl ester carboxylesterase
MKINPSYEHVWTEDDLRLQGMHYWANGADTCVLMIHGMAGNFIDNTFGHVLGEACIDAGVGYIYSHNRGWGIVNDINTKKKSADGGYLTKRNGAVYERFSDCMYDIDAWVNKARSLGYTKIILIGHSLAGPKTIYFLSKKQPREITGLILASAADMVGLTKRDEGDRYQATVSEAMQLVRQGKSDALLHHPLGGWVRLSAQTFLDESIDGAPADVLPLMRNPDIFPELASINLPILALLGEQDSVIIDTAEKDLERIKEKATKASSFSSVIISGADHVYEGKEQEFSTVIINWLQKIGN